MSVGAGIAWSTLLVLLAIGVQRVSLSRKWQPVARTIACLVMVSGLMSLSINGWSKPKDRPQVPSELAGVKLGMTPIEVTLALGPPTTEERPADPDGGNSRRAALRYSYTVPNNNQYALEIVFYEDANDLRADIICELGGYSSALGFSKGMGQFAVFRKLGRPERTSISSDRQAKVISYPQWKVAYILKRSKVNGVCISRTGVIRFTDQARTRPSRR